MNPNPRLSVTIPTYKRPDQLRECVRSVIHSAREHAVSIHVVDDAADDTNNQVFAELQAEYPLFIVHRNEENLGIDRNILKSVDVCQSEYAWIIGEDDRMVPDGVSKVLEALDQHPNVPFLYANYSSVDDEVSFMIYRQSVPMDADKIVAAETFYREYAWSMGFIGACVINTSAWSKTDPAPYLDTFYAHVGRILESIHGQEVPMLASPLILNRCGTPGAFTWTSVATQVLTGWGKMASALDPLYGQEAGKESTDRYAHAHGLGTLKLLAYLRAGKAYNLSMYRELVQVGNPTIPYRIMAWLLAIAPAFPFKGLQQILMAWRRKRSTPLPLHSPTS